MTRSNLAATVFQAGNAPDGSSWATVAPEDAIRGCLSGFFVTSVSFSGMSVRVSCLFGAFSGR